jgi:T-complex protein 1 subunit theta
MAKSMALNAAAGLGGMLKDGHKSFEGTQGAVLRNIEAAKAIAGMVQTSLGPNGMNKLVVNHLEKIIVTSDCATIVKELEIQHPAAKILVMGAEMQESEYGDNTNFVISFGGELLKMAEKLIHDGLHTAEIVEGYQRAHTKALEILPELVVKTISDVRDTTQMKTAIKNVLATKQYGYEDLLTDLVVGACQCTMPPASTQMKGARTDISLDSVRFAKLRGGAVDQSTMLQGMVILRDAEGIVKKASGKVLVLGCELQATQSEAKGTVLIRNAEELLNYNKSEEKKMEEIVKGIADSGVKCVIANGAVSEMALHFCDRYGLMVIKITSKFELRRLCGALGATACVRLGAPTPEECGEVSSIEVVEVGGRKIILLKQDKAEDTSVATIVIRASTENVANDIERALDDGVHSTKTLCSDPRLLPGAGAVELELARRLKAFADETLGLDQYAIRMFADALDVVPRTLAENSGCDPTSIMYTLHNSHNPSAGGSPNMGFDIETCEPADSVEKEIYDLLATKVNALRLAVDAALTILKVDQIVMSKPAGGPKPGGPGQ